MKNKKPYDDHLGFPLEASIANSKIIIRQIDRVYQSKKSSVKAIADVSMEIQDNDFVCVVGPSGCGKSTLLRMIAGLDFPTNGEIIVNDKKITGPGADRGMVFQTYTLFPWMTVENNIKFGLKHRKIPVDEMNKITEKYLEIIKLTKFRNSYPKELSGGMKQRVAIARALANQPEVLLMDEPFGALDPHTKESMQLLLRKTWQVEKPTIVFITHDIDEAVFLANKIYVMTARPGMIREEVNLYLPYDRKIELKDTAEFIQIRKHINNVLYENSKEEED